MQLNSLGTPKYLYVWKKYKPVLVKLMVDAVEEPQHFQLSGHEFKDIDARSCSFSLEVLDGKALNVVKVSLIAKELLYILKQSGRAVELMTNAQYTYKMGADFILHVTRSEMTSDEKEVE